jgi:hypothetical protein
MCASEPLVFPSAKKALVCATILEGLQLSLLTIVGDFDGLAANFTIFNINLLAIHGGIQNK